MTHICLKSSISTNTVTETANSVLAEQPTSITVSTPGLSTFAESANVLEVTSPAPVNIERQISQPYKIDVPTELLQRNFLVASFNWTPGMITQRIDFPAAFSGITTIADVMKKFAYWRATIHVEIKLSTTQFHQGSLLTSWFPVAGASIPTNNKIKHTGLNSACILSASTQESVSYDIPYLHPLDWLDWRLYGNSSAHSSLFIQEFNALTATSTGISTSCPVLVYASMKDVQVSGFQSQAHQGRKYVANAEAQAKKDTFDVSGAVSTVSKIARKLPVVGEVWNPIADAAKMFGFDLSKPVVQSTPTLTETRLMSTANLASGVDDSTQLSLYPNAQVTQAPSMFGMDTSHMSVARIAQTPMLFNSTTFDGTTTSWSTIVTPKAAVGIYADYLHQTSRLFKYWRGSIKYLVHFCMPAFYQCRIQFTVDYLGAPSNIGDIPSRTVDIKGTTWETISVPYLDPLTWRRTDDSYTTPILKITQLTSILGSNAIDTPKIYVNIFRAAGEDWEYAVPRALNTSWTQQEPEVGFHNQCCIGQKFQNKFETILQGVTQSIESRNVMSEVVGTAADLTKRLAPLPGFPTPPSVSLTLGYPDLLTQIMKFFLFWRGSRTYKHMANRTGNNPMIKATLFTGSTTPSVSDGFAWISPDPAYLLISESFNVPYTCCQPYYPLPVSTDTIVHISAYADLPTSVRLDSYTGTYGTDWYMHGGDDFVLLFLHPFTMYLTPPGEAKEPKDTKAVLPRPKS